MTTPNVGSPLWPANFQGCLVTAQYLNLAGQAMAGSVTFTASPAALIDANADLIIVPSTFTATLDASGSISIILPATDDTDINPSNFTYAVSENFSGGRRYNIQAPQGQQIDLAEVSPIGLSNGVPIYRGPRGQAGGVQMVNGKTGDIVTLNYSDVGADPAGAAASALASALQRLNNLSDLGNAAIARNNLGLGTMATQASSDYTNNTTLNSEIGSIYSTITAMNTSLQGLINQRSYGTLGSAFSTNAPTLTTAGTDYSTGPGGTGGSASVTVDSTDVIPASAYPRRVLVYARARFQCAASAPAHYQFQTCYGPDVTVANATALGGGAGHANAQDTGLNGSVTIEHSATAVQANNSGQVYFALGRRASGGSSSDIMTSMAIIVTDLGPA